MNIPDQKLGRTFLAYFPISLLLILIAILQIQIPVWLLLATILLFCFLSFELVRNTWNGKIFDPSVKVEVIRQAKSPIRAYRKWSGWNNKLFYGHEQLGAVSLDLKPQINRPSGRQSGEKQSKKQGTGSKSDDTDGEGGEPPQQLYSYKTLSQLLDCSEKTLRNKVSAGKVQPPRKTAVGPRFTSAQIQNLLYPPNQNELIEITRKRGRPRIALENQNHQGGVA